MPRRRPRECVTSCHEDRGATSRTGDKPVVGGPVAGRSARLGTALARMTAMPSILVVDDCQPIADILARYLRLEGHDVSIANEGAAARALVARRTPDCIFLDLMMPVMTGVELLHELKRDPATAAIPIVVVSARIGAGLTHVFSQHEANHSIGKPFTRRHVQDAIAAVLPRAPRVAPGAASRPAARGPFTYSI